MLVKENERVNIDALKEKFEAAALFHVRYREIQENSAISKADKKRVTEIYQRYNSGMITFFAALQGNNDADVQSLFGKYNKDDALFNVQKHAHIKPQDVRQISDQTIDKDAKETLARFAAVARDKTTVQLLNGYYDNIENYFKAYTIDVKELEKKLGIENVSSPSSFLHDIDQARKDTILSKMGEKISALNQEKSQLGKTDPSRVTGIDTELDYLIKTRNIVSMAGLDKKYLEIDLKNLKEFSQKDYESLLRIEKAIRENPATQQQAVASLVTQLEGLEAKKAKEITPFQSREKIADFYKISEMFAKNLRTDKNGVADLLQQLEQGRDIPSLATTPTDSPSRQSPGNFSALAAALGAPRLVSAEDEVAFQVARGVVDKLKADRKNISPETERQIITTLVPKLERLAGTHLKGNEDNLAQKLASDIAKEQTIASKLFGSFKISAENLAKIDVSPTKFPSGKEPVLSQHSDLGSGSAAQEEKAVAALVADIFPPPRSTVVAASPPPLALVVPPVPNQLDNKTARRQLRDATSSGNVDEVTKLLKDQKSIRSEDVGEALRIAARNGNNKIVKVIMDNAQDISKSDKGEALRIAAAESDTTPAALKEQKAEVVSTLLKKGGIHTEDRAEAYRHASKKTRKKFNPKDEEKFKKRGKQAHILRNTIRDYDQKQPDQKTTGLRINPPVSKQKQFAMIANQLKSATYHDKIEGLRIAAKHGKTDVVKLLLEDKDVQKDKRGLGEALRVAAKYGQSEVVGTLLDGTGKNISSHDKSEALRNAEQADSKGKAARRLLKSHIEKEIASKNPQTPSFVNRINHQTDASSRTH